MTTYHEVPASIPGSAMGMDNGLGSLVEIRFKVPPVTSYSYITIHLIGTT
jgi:hypothetical protein